MKSARCGMTVLAILVLLSGAALAQNPDRSDEEVPYGVASDWIVGHKLLEEGLPGEALPYLHMAYRSQPDNPSIALDFQEALVAEGYLGDAVKVLDQLVTTWPDSMEYRVRRADLYQRSGKTDLALADLRYAREHGLVSLGVLSAEASILAERGDTGQALDVLRDGLHLHPEAGGEIYLAMSGVLQQAGQADAIPGLMDEALTPYPNDPAIWMVKIRSQAALGLEAEALETALAADDHFNALLVKDEGEPGTGPEDAMIEAHSRYPEIMPQESFVVELADFYAQNDRPGKAVAVLQPMADSGDLTLGPSLWLARLLLGSGRYEEGRLMVDQIVERWPDTGRGWYLKGMISQGEGNWDEALPYYRKAADLADRDPEIRLGLIRAMLVAWEGDLTESATDSLAVEHKRELKENTLVAITIVPAQDYEGQLILGYALRASGELQRAADRFAKAAESKDLRLMALIQKSISHDQMGQVGEARADLERLRHEYPDDAEVANSLGYFLAEKGQDLDLAEGLIEEALAKEPGNGAYLDSMGWVLYRKGNLDGALDYLIRAVNVIPEDPVILEHLGMILRDLGQPTEALDVLKRSLGTGGDRERLTAVISEIESGLDGKN